MKKFNIQLDDLDDILSKLWEMCQGNGEYLVCPDKNLIKVYDKDTNKIAELNVIAIDDTYDVRDNLFK